MGKKSRGNWRLPLCLPSCKCPQCRVKNERKRYSKTVQKTKRKSDVGI